VGEVEGSGFAEDSVGFRVNDSFCDFYVYGADKVIILFLIISAVVVFIYSLKLFRRKRTEFLGRSFRVLLRREEGLGEGDMELMAFVGAFLGVKGALFAMWVGFVVGGLLALILMIAKRVTRKYAIPFGPFFGLWSFYLCCGR